MKKGYFIFPILLFTKLFGGPADSLVKLSDLAFRNETEKIALTKFDANRKNPDYIDLFLATFDNNGEPRSLGIHQRITDYAASLKKEIQDKAEPKKVKYVYEQVHKAFFKGYKLKNSFTDIFDKGEYNCVSASALYSIIFTMLEIPFQIMESPQHVYLVTYPQTLKILIETTIPEKGYYKFSDNFIDKYIKTLANSKLISKEEFDANSANVLFNKYYFSKSGVSLLQLAGFQYSNFAVFSIEDNNYEKALEEIKKSYFLLPTERNRNILKIALQHIISSNKYEKKEYVTDLAMLFRFNALKDEDVTGERLKNEFLRLTEATLIGKSDYDLYDKYYLQIKEAAKDSLLGKEIDFIYNYELARLGFQNMKDDKYEKEHLLAAYKANPQHANLQGIILACFGREIEKSNEPNFILGLMKEYMSKFDFLKEHNRFNTVRANCLLELAYQSFSLNDMVKGENYLKDFEAVCSSNKSLEPSPVYIEKAYSVPAGIYYKKGNYAKSKQLLKTGLLYAPDSFGLKQRLNQF